MRFHSPYLTYLGVWSCGLVLTAVLCPWCIAWLCGPASWINPTSARCTASPCPLGGIAIFLSFFFTLGLHCATCWECHVSVARSRGGSSAP